MAPKPKPITVVHNFGVPPADFHYKQMVTSMRRMGFDGGRRGSGVPVSVQDWGLWDCDPTKTGPPSRQHAYGKDFPWMFDKLEKAYILEGEATLTPDNATLHGEAVRIAPKDMVTFPKGWKGRWEVHSFLKKHYAFFDGKGLRVDEASDSEDDEEEVKAEPSGPMRKTNKGKASPKAAAATRQGRTKEKAEPKAAGTKATVKGKTEARRPGAKAKAAPTSKASSNSGSKPASKRRRA